jgi:hypothetical protein
VKPGAGRLSWPRRELDGGVPRDQACFVRIALNAHRHCMDGGMFATARTTSCGPSKFPPESRLPRIQLWSAGADIHAGGRVFVAERTPAQVNRR